MYYEQKKQQKKANSENLLFKFNKQTVRFKTFLSFKLRPCIGYRGRHYILHMIDICHMAGLKEPPGCRFVI